MGIVVTEFVSLDGVMEDPGGAEGYVHGGWTFPYMSDEIGKLKLGEVLAAESQLLGRVTYEGFAAAWPSRTDDAGFADKMNSMPKYVVSTTLDRAEWNNSKKISFDEVAGLRARGGDFLVAGSATLVRSLLQAELVDELRLLVYPVLLGVGKRLLGDTHKIELELAETRSFDSGVALLTYRSKK